jgi:pimeloyl-ACP methyl ester carboxylesterase
MERDIAAAAVDATSRVEGFAAEADVRIAQAGAGRPALLLHGGGGPPTVAAFAKDLARHCHVITPTHPGFGHTNRPAEMASVKDLARLYVALLERADLRDTLVIGCSLGGWIAAEMGVAKSANIAGLVIVNACGIAVPGETVLDVFSVAPSELASYSYHAPDQYRVDMTKLSEQQAATMRSNFAALAAYGRAQNMQDPDLRDRLAAVQPPALVVWGESDRVVTPAYGRAYAAAFPNGRFELIPECGHLPQIEQRQRLLDIVTKFGRTLSEPAARTH